MIKKNLNRNTPGKPIFTPRAKIELGLYTSGKEYMDAETFEEFKGAYHRYPNMAVYSGGEYGDESRKLTIYTRAIEPATRIDDTNIKDSFNNSMYFQLTNKRFNNHIEPPYYYPLPDKSDYSVLQITRYFVQKINDTNDITEVNVDEFQAVNADNEVGIDKGTHRKIGIKWTIDGPLDAVRKANHTALKHANQRLPGLASYLSDLDEFHPRRHLISDEKIKDDREYFDGEAIDKNLPITYNVSQAPLQNCNNCALRKNNHCHLWNASIRPEYWCVSWEESS